MKIKVCGMKYPDNIEQLLALPIDMVGFIFYAKSPRHVDEKVLRTWLAKHDSAFGEIRKVGVFVNAELEEILNKIHDFKLDFIQLHGNESPEYCMELRSFWDMSTIRRAKIIKAFAVDENFDFNTTMLYEGKCELFLFDTKGKEQGGNGVAFDWQLIQAYKGLTPFLLSGGIDLGMEKALTDLSFPQLMGVDINSRFETAPGRKDIEKVNKFVEQITTVKS